jgi:ubiquitin fusion degradation protein 1
MNAADMFSALLGGGYGGGGMGMPSSVSGQFRCYSVSILGRAEVEEGDKVILPASFFERLTRAEVQFPMQFRAVNPALGCATHCGVLEFTAVEGRVFVPHWVMQSLLLAEGAFVDVRNLQLPKARLVKLRPQTKDFIELADPKAFLEHQLRLFSCLTKGDTVVIFHEGLRKNFHVDVLDLKPADACSIIETDLTVDFAAPLDYVEPVRPAAAASPASGRSRNPCRR